MCLITIESAKNCKHRCQNILLSIWKGNVNYCWLVVQDIITVLYSLVAVIENTKILKKKILYHIMI